MCVCVCVCVCESVVLQRCHYVIPSTNTLVLTQIRVCVRESVWERTRECVSVLQRCHYNMPNTHTSACLICKTDLCVKVFYAYLTHTYLCVRAFVCVRVWECVCVLCCRDNTATCPSWTHSRVKWIYIYTYVCVHTYIYIYIYTYTYIHIHVRT